MKSLNFGGIRGSAHGAGCIPEPAFEGGNVQVFFGWWWESKYRRLGRVLVLFLFVAFSVSSSLLPPQISVGPSKSGHIGMNQAAISHLTFGRLMLRKANVKHNS